MALKPGQEKCINTLDRSIVVAAGAGSGKTFTLTKRIVHAISTGAVDGIERICAITFTNKAAGELKSRIKSELRSCGLADQALKVDDAWVSTIHGMCARILRAHAVELDLDPSFKMADPDLVIRLRDEAIDAVLQQAQAGVDLPGDEEASGMAGGGMAGGAGADEAPEGSPGDGGAESSADPSITAESLDALFAEYPARSQGPRGTSVESMIQMLMGLAGANPRGFQAFVLPKAKVNPAQLVSLVLETFEAVSDATAAQKPTDARQEFMALVEQRAVAVRKEMEGGKAGDPLWALRALDSLPMPKRVGTADYKAQVEEALGLYRQCVMELRLAAAVPHLQALVALARQATVLFSHLKRLEGVLDNDDLLILAHEAIDGHPDIAAQYTDKFQLIMVDEFQDTDQMQVDMIKRLAGPGACRLCTVGDAQQSIYRFRGADVSVYRRHLEEVRAGNPEDVIMLPDNFRSHADVLALVDRVFERAEMFGGEFMSLAPGRDEARVKRPFAEGMPRVQVQLTSNPYRGVLAEEVRAKAAERIADAFAELRDAGHSAGEMAVLLGGMTHADVYARALRDRGLACVISGGSVFAKAPEAAIVADLARVVANPFNTQALFNVLTSPMFRLDAGELLQLVTMADKEDGLPRRRNLCKGLQACVRAWRKDEGADAGWSPRLRLAVRVMGRLMGGSGRSLVSRLITQAVVGSGWISRLQAQGAEGLASAANVYKAIRMIEDIEREQAVGPAQVARLFQVLLDESKEAPGALSAAGGDFVRIMTVHASKGLEFPIVAVGEFKDASGPAGKLLTCEVEGSVYLSLDLGNTVKALEGRANLQELPALCAEVMEGRVDEDELQQAIENAEGALQLRAALFEHERVGDVEEAKRLLYVALTRAKEALVVSLMGKRTKDNPCGTPHNCLGALVPALTGEDGGFEEGASRFEFGGSTPACVEHVALVADGADESNGEGNGDGSSSSAGADATAEAGEASARAEAAELFAVPAEAPYVPVARLLYAPAHEGVFSYSSVAEASHEGDLLEQLASRFFVEADSADRGFGAALEADAADERAEADVAAGIGGATDDPSAFLPTMARLNRNAAVTDEDDGSWAYTGSISVDSDKATDLGTAFHRLAQLAVIRRAGSGSLVEPPADRVKALARACGLDGLQLARLKAALQRWFGCDLAREAAQLADLAAEVPFFVSVPLEGALAARAAHDAGVAASGSGAGVAAGAAEADAGIAAPDADADSPAYLEGEIDLLGYDEAHEHATVVDYKTGGTAEESLDALRVKHVLQASCYAYAIMLQGARQVDAVFVRVERSRADDPAQPQCVRYRFAADDLPVLRNAIAQAYSQAWQPS